MASQPDASPRSAPGPLARGLARPRKEKPHTDSGGSGGQGERAYLDGQGIVRGARVTAAPLVARLRPNETPTVVVVDGGLVLARAPRGNPASGEKAGAREGQVSEKSRGGRDLAGSQPRLREDRTRRGSGSSGAGEVGEGSSTKST